MSNYDSLNVQDTPKKLILVHFEKKVFNSKLKSQFLLLKNKAKASYLQINLGGALFLNFAPYSIIYGTSTATNALLSTIAKYFPLIYPLNSLTLGLN